jgi:hypothetical protein
MQSPILIRLMTFCMAEILSKTEPRHQSYDELSQKDNNDILTNSDGQVSRCLNIFKDLKIIRSV